MFATTVDKCPTARRYRKPAIRIIISAVRLSHKQTAVGVPNLFTGVIELFSITFLKRAYESHKTMREKSIGPIRYLHHGGDKKKSSWS